MHSGIRKLTYLGLFLALIVGATGCTTTTKKLTTTKPRIDSSLQLSKAREAFEQKNYKQAAELLIPLAEQGDPDAQYALGYLYHNGQGVPRNYKLAIQWITAASAKGNEKATEALRRISEQSHDIPDEKIQNVTQQPAGTETNTPILISDKKPVVADAGEETAPATDISTDTTAFPETTSVTETSTENTAAPEPEVIQKSDNEPIENTASEPTTTIPAKASVFSESEKWIIDQPSENYTIQIIATSNESHMQRFVEENNLGKDTHYYKTSKNGKYFFTLIQGSYASFSMAKNAISNLSQNLQRLKPWIKPISAAQKDIKNR